MYKYSVKKDWHGSFASICRQTKFQSDHWVTLQYSFVKYRHNNINKNEFTTEKKKKNQNICLSDLSSHDYFCFVFSLIFSFMHFSIELYCWLDRIDCYFSISFLRFCFCFNTFGRVLLFTHKYNWYWSIFLISKLILWRMHLIHCDWIFSFFIM